MSTFHRVPWVEHQQEALAPSMPLLTEHWAWTLAHYEEQIALVQNLAGERERAGVLYDRSTLLHQHHSGDDCNPRCTLLWFTRDEDEQPEPFPEGPLGDSNSSDLGPIIDSDLDRTRQDEFGHRPPKPGEPGYIGIVNANPNHRNGADGPSY